MEATKGFVPRPPAGKRPENLPKHRPGCRYVRRSSTDEKPFRTDSAERKNTNVSDNGTQSTSERTKTAMACAQKARAEEFTETRPISKRGRNTDVFDTPLSEKMMEEGKRIDAQCAALMERLLKNRSKVLASELFYNDNSPNNKSTEKKVAEEKFKLDIKMEDDQTIVKRKIDGLKTLLSDKYGDTQYMSKIKHLKKLLSEKNEEKDNDNVNDNDIEDDDDNDNDGDDNVPSTCDILVVHPSNGEPVCPQNIQLSSQNGCNPKPNETSEMGGLPPEADRPKRPKDWDTVSVSAIVELEMMKEDLEHRMVDDLERLGRLLNLETKHNSRDNTAMVGEIEHIVPVIRQEIEDCEDDDDEPYIHPPMSDPNELYEYWDTSTGRLVWYPHLPKGCLEEEKSVSHNVEESMPSDSSLCKAISKCPTLNSIQEEEENEVFSETEEVEQKQNEVDKKAEHQKTRETEKENEVKQEEENSSSCSESTSIVVTSGVASRVTNKLDSYSKLNAGPIIDRKSKSNESMDNVHTSAEDSFRSESSVTLYERPSTPTVLKSSVDLTQESSEPKSTFTVTNTQPITDASVNTLSKETVSQIGSLFVEVSDRQMTLSSFNPSSMIMSDESYSQPCSNKIQVEESEKLEMNSAPVMPSKQLPHTIHDGEHVPSDEKAHKVPVSAPTLVSYSCKNSDRHVLVDDNACNKKVCNPLVCTPEMEFVAAKVKTMENQSETVSTKSLNGDSAAEQEEAVKTLDEKEKIVHTMTNTKKASLGTEIAHKIEKLLTEVVQIRTVGNNTKFSKSQGSKAKPSDEKLQADKKKVIVDSTECDSSPTAIQTHTSDQTNGVLSKLELNFKKCKATIGRIPNPVRMKINFNDLIQQNCTANEKEGSKMVTNAGLHQHFPNRIHNQHLTGSFLTHEGDPPGLFSQASEDINIAESCTQSYLTAGDQTRCIASGTAVSTPCNAHEQKQNSSSGKPASSKGSKECKTNEQRKSKNKKSSSEQNAHFPRELSQSKQSSVNHSGPVIKGKSSLPSRKYQQAVMKTKSSLGGSVLPSKLLKPNNRKNVSSYEVSKEHVVGTVVPSPKSGSANISQQVKVSNTVSEAIPCQDTFEADLATKATNRPATFKSSVTATTYSNTKHFESPLKSAKKRHSDPDKKRSKGTEINTEKTTKEGSRKMTPVSKNASKPVQLNHTELPLMPKRKSAKVRNKERTSSANSINVMTPQRKKSSQKLVPISEPVHKPTTDMGQSKASSDNIQLDIEGQCSLKNKKQMLLLTAFRKYSCDGISGFQHPQSEQSKATSLPKIPLTSNGEECNVTTRINANRDYKFTETKLRSNSTSTLSTLPKEHLAGQTQYSSHETTKAGNSTCEVDETQTKKWYSSLPPITQQQTQTLPKKHVPEVKVVGTPMGAEMFMQCFKSKQLVPPEIYSLPKLQPTSDGQGLDASAWIKANGKRVKEIYAKYRETHDESDVDSMTEVVRKASNPIEEARANLNKKMPRPLTAQLNNDVNQFHIAQKTKTVKLCQGDMHHEQQVLDRKPKYDTSKLTKLRLTSDGEGYDASAWIRENRHLILGEKNQEQPAIGVLQSSKDNDDKLPQIMN